MIKRHNNKNSVLINFKIIFTFLVAIIIFQNTYSQNDRNDIILEDLVEDIASNSDVDVDYSTIYDDLQFYLDNPLNLNDATKDDLNKLHFLDQIQINSILNYRKDYGNFQTKYELQLLAGFDKDDIEILLPFISIAPGQQKVDFNFGNALRYGNHQIFMRTQTYVQPQKGYNMDSILLEDPDKSHYIGNSYRYYMRYKFQYRDKIQWGFTAEKDPGEQFFTGAQKYGFDYYSAHVQLSNMGRFEKVVVGDYQAQFGQGLALWTGLGFGKSSMVLNIKKKPRGLRKYSSTDENQFLRGGGVTTKFGNFTVTAFGSYHKIDANISVIDSIDDFQVAEISSLQITGLHRTPSEVIDKHAIGQTIFGGNVSYSGNWLKTGLTFVNYQFSADLNKTPKPYQMYQFLGNENFNIGWDYEFEIKKMYFFGESAISQNGGLATVNGVIVPLEHRVSLVALYRNYSRDYQAYFSGSFAEGSQINNEKGIYFGLEVYPYPKFKISSYIDSYTFPWLKYRINAANSNGLEYLTQIDYNPSRSVSMYTRFKKEIKPQNISSEADATILYPLDVSKWAFRYHISFQLSRNWTLRNRIEFSGYEKENELQTGFMAYQDINYSASNIPLKLNFRYAVFDAPYDARIYAYENDILYAFSVPGYFYKGFRTYLTAKYDISQSLTIWLRYSQSTYTDRNVLSEGGLDEIEGNVKSEVKAQIRYKF